VARLRDFLLMPPLLNTTLVEVAAAFRMLPNDIDEKLFTQIQLSNRTMKSNALVVNTFLLVFLLP
jgi:hypothetical protein